MSTDDGLASLCERLSALDQGLPRQRSVVLLPDFFIDHLVQLHGLDQTVQRIQTVVARGGGNIPKVKQRLHQGGNAANTALACARLGLRSHLICRTDPLGELLLDFFLAPHGVDLSGVKVDGELAMTTALEFGATHTNVMINDAGSVSSFTFELLSEADLALIADADLVGVVNWTLNEAGTALAADVFRHASRNGVTTFLDTGDPSHRTRDIPTLLQEVIRAPTLSILSVNENELTHYSAASGHGNSIAQRAIGLKAHLSARLDVHTSGGSLSLGKDQAFAPTFHLPAVYRSTGAGDSWNAGNLFAELCGFTVKERLLFANAVAGCYLSRPEPLPPTLSDVTTFLTDTPLAREAYASLE